MKKIPNQSFLLNKNHANQTTEIIEEPKLLYNSGS